MIIQCYPELLDYVNAQLHPLAPKPGAFLELFLHACLRADAENFELPRPTLQLLTLKYPANVDRLKQEKHDRGVGDSNDG